ncbi:hypothetical protein [Rhizobium straminoryzae]|uniref:Helix-turn-helix domain-containing protein n=1 Tax=Rhizobium straminoryzae TaxID=1387186 RepID=A0A549TD23_9HYPH|nr:hypothetical protein [Rhizobium straminoryzae]TRL39853.1 hypothetical protein FNA46_07920 [Rhizobium straminoryzae]
MQLEQKLVGLPEICAAFGVSEAWVRRHHRRLSREKGMPEKCSMGWVWPRKRFEDWIDGAYGRAAIEEAEEPAARVPTMIANQNQRLRARYARAGA